MSKNGVFYFLIERKDGKVLLNFIEQKVPWYRKPRDIKFELNTDVWKQIKNIKDEEIK